VCCIYGVPERKIIPESIRETPVSLFSQDVVYGVPFGAIRAIHSLTSLSNSEIVDTCRHLFSSVMNEDKAAYDTLGAEYHSHLDKTLSLG
jgi:hypothetical protein